jgi:hypothetical protein
MTGLGFKGCKEENTCAEALAESIGVKLVAAIPADKAALAPINCRLDKAL